MIQITENYINQIIEKYEVESNYLEDLAQLFKEQTPLSAYLDQENYSLLTKDEMSLLEYLSCVIYFASKLGVKKHLVLTGKILDESEEKNWDTFNSTKENNFTKILDVFFDKYPQEDLLALVEDSIIPDEENVVTKVGCEIIFVSCKSLIDTLHILN